MLRAVKLGSKTSLTSNNTIVAFRDLQLGNQDMFDLLWKFHNTKCSDPRDALAALHGLCDKKKGPPDSLLVCNSSRTKIYSKHAKLIISSPRQEEFLAHILSFGGLHEWTNLCLLGCRIGPNHANMSLYMLPI